MTNETTENKKTDLRQADAILMVEGVLSEKTLEVTTEDGKNVIKGNLVIQTSDINFVTVNVYVGEFTKAGKKNTAYTGMTTVMENYKSIAEVGADEATRVRVNKGQIAPNTYFDESGQHDIIRYRVSYISSLNPDEDLDCRAEFEMEIFIHAIENEKDKNGEDTGRLVVKGLLPTFDGIEPIDLIAPEEIADVIDSTYELGQTVRFTGELVNNRVVTTVEIPMAIGKPIKKTNTTYKNELVITGASEPYEEEAAYKQETIQKAMVERKASLDEKEAKAKAGKGGTKNSATQSGATKKSTARKLPF